MRPLAKKYRPSHHDGCRQQSRNLRHSLTQKCVWKKSNAHIFQLLMAIRKRFKIPRLHGPAGSSPAARTKLKSANSSLYQVLLTETHLGIPAIGCFLIQGGKRMEPLPWVLRFLCRDDFRCGGASVAGAAHARRQSGPSPAGTGGDLRRRFAGRCGADRQCRSADGARLGAAVQRGGAGRSCRRQGAGADAEAQRGPAPGACPDCRERADPGGTRGCPLAADRSRPMGLGRVPGFGLEADPEPGTAGDGFPQALSARPRHRAQNEHALEAFKKTSPPRGGYCTAQSSRRTDRDMVPADEARIGQKNKITTALGQAWHAAPRTP